MELIIENLSKRYANNWALKDISLRLEAGMVGLVGPNGAGKTTLMRIISTLLPQTEGRVTWDGQDSRANGQQIRQVLGYLPQDFGVYPEFTARRFLRYLAAMKGIPKPVAQRRVDEVLELVNLQNEADRKLGDFSGGMKQRVGIAQALLNDPELLIVDEPTAGLDPQERVRFRTLLASLTTSRLIILSTHIISDVEAVASRLVILSQGKMLSDTTPEKLLASANGQVWSILTDHDSALRLQAEYQVSALIAQRDGVQMHIISPVRPHPQAYQIEPSLEDAYLVAVREKASALT
jgi:ABC-2 type transport system ATP-binding protein